MAEDHHVIAQQRIKIAVGRAAIKAKTVGHELTRGEQKLLDTPLTTVLNDRRNIVRLASTARHHRAHHGVKPERLKREDLHSQIDEFADEYGLTWALERELAMIDEAA